jgi:hypothetical protein
MTAPRPCTPEKAVERALSMVGRTEPYILGTGDFRKDSPLPFTTNLYGYGCDCWGLAGAWCYELPRHRPGFNHGPWATVSDDINCDSAIEDAEHKQELWTVADRPMAGDLLVFPSIRDKDRKRVRIGHVGIVVGVSAEWDVKAPQFGALTVVQCQASKKPAIMKGPGHGWMFRATFRGLTDDAWRTRTLRAVP